MTKLLASTAVALLFAGSGASALLGGRPAVWAARPMTISEAMANRDQGEVVLHERAGARASKRKPASEPALRSECVMLQQLRQLVPQQ